MKRVIIIFLISLLLFSCVSKLAQKTRVETAKKNPHFAVLTTAYVLRDRAPLRQGPGKKFPIITPLQDGDQVRILKNTKGWYNVSTDQDKKGWVRSYLVGPRSLSRTAMAAAFNDSIMTHFKAKLYIDKNKPYKVIYLETNEPDITKAKKMARIIGKAFQKKVYPGKITINLIRPHQSKYFAQVVLPAKGLAQIPVPVIEYGYLEKLIVKGKTVRLIVRVPNGLSKKVLLKLARKASSAYSYPFTKSEIVIRVTGISKKCLLYYVEDEYGENYAFGKCRIK